jgi:hypothetical protein
MDSSVSTWLAIIAIVSTLQLLATAFAIFFVIRQANRASATLAALASDAGPVLRRTSAVLDDLQDLAERARRADEAAHAVVDRVNSTWIQARAVVLSRLWPVVGVARGLMAMAGALGRRRTNAIDRNAEQRFTYEGGSHAVE